MILPRQSIVCAGGLKHLLTGKFTQKRELSLNRDTCCGEGEDFQGIMTTFESFSQTKHHMTAEDLEYSKMSHMNFCYGFLLDNIKCAL